ncbi:MAG: response regulator transcription factor [Campylobacterota bacterium]
MIKVLMVEDDLELADVIIRYLKSFDIEVTNTDSPYMGLSHLNQQDFDLLILDLTLPEMDGLEMIVKIREQSKIPIIISSARDDILDKVMGLDRGADDYLPKPYDPRELEARIKSVLRRKNETGEAAALDTNILFEVKNNTIRFKGQILDLTLAEFDILNLLIQRQNSAVSREEFIYASEHIDDESSLKNIDVMVSRLRNKIAKIDGSKKYIKSMRGIGYGLFV